MGDTAQETGETVSFPSLRGMLGTEEAVLWADEVSEPGVWALQRELSAGEWELVSVTSPPWVDPGAPQGRRYRLLALETGHYSPPIVPEPIALQLSVREELILNGELLPLEISVEGTPPRPLNLSLSTSMSPETCPTAVAWSGVVYMDGPVEVPAISVQQSAPAICDVVATVWLDDAAGGHTLLSSRVEYIGLGYALSWGDMHAHSNLSNDGCERPEAGCVSRDGVAAGDFFENGLALGLDFAAITDHAEYEWYVPDGQTARLSIWERQLEAVLYAEGNELIPLLGYEWTSTSGHKTVLLEEPDACSAYRVSGREEDDLTNSVRIGPGDLFFPGNSVVGTTPSALWAALDAAAESCMPSRALTIAHHSAYSIPMNTDWSDGTRAPDPRYETVIEITSEHGTSECLSLEHELCDYRIKMTGNYMAEGSVQWALGMGYPLGFVAGTDSHDSRPGSIEDGPSAISFLTTGSLPFHDYPGGLTAILHDGPLTRTALFDALYARHSLASTGPRPTVRVILQGSAGGLFFPGDVIDTSQGPFQLHLHVDEIPDALTVLGMEIIDPISGDILDRSLYTPQWSTPLDLQPGDALYVRARLETESGEEERIWISPFFGANVE